MFSTASYTRGNAGCSDFFVSLFNNTDVYYRCGVGRGKDVLTEVLGEKFGGTGVTDDYASYDSIFTRHQLCWAHFLRKAIELMLRNPTERKYRSTSSQGRPREQDGEGSEKAWYDSFGVRHLETTHGAIHARESFESRLRRIRLGNLSFQHRQSEKSKNDCVRK